MKLTTEQKKLVENNHNLIYHVLNQHGWSIDEYYDVAALGLCAAAIKYDKSRGCEFSTYACIAIKNSVLVELRKSRAQRRSGIVIVSLNDYEDFVESLDDAPEDVMKCCAIYEEVKRLPQKQRKIMQLRLDGYAQGEIAQAMKISQSQVSRLLKSARKKLSDLV